MLQRFLKNQHGGLVVFAAILIPTVMIGVGSAVDMSRYLNAKAKFAQSLDNSLLSAAASSKTQNVSSIARQFFNANYSAEELATLKNVNIRVTGGEGANAAAWTIHGTANVDMRFAKFVGVNDLQLEHNAKVEFDSSKQVEVVFTADTSSSMCMTTTRAPRGADGITMEYRPDPNCTKLNALKEALTYVLQYGFMPIQSAGGPTFKVGIVPFNHKVKLPNLSRIPEPLSYVETTHAKGAANYYTDFSDAEPLSATIPLTGLAAGTQQQLINQINGINQRPEGMGWTRSNIATLTAALMLDPDYNASFGGTRPNEFDPANTEKVVVMMTDGANIGCCFAAWPEGNYGNQYLYLYEADNAHLTGLSKAPDMRRWASQYNIPDQGICDQMKQHGVTIYSVVFDVDDRDPGGRAIKDAYRQCSSNEQFFFDVSTGDELKLAYKTIAQSFLRLRLSE